MTDEKRMTWVLLLVILALIIVAGLLVPADAYGTDLQGLRSRTERLLGQDTAADNKDWPDVVLNAWIADGINFVSVAAQCVERETTIVILASTIDYAMPSDFIDITGVTFSRAGSAIEMDMSARGLSEALPSALGKVSGDRSMGPTQYRDLGPVTKLMRISPTPVGTDTAKVSYLAYGVALSLDTATCDIPLAFQSAVASYAAWKLSLIHI